MNRREFLKLTLSTAAVAAVAPTFVAPAVAELPALDVARNLRGSYDGGQTFFKLKGEIVARDLGDRIEFEGWINAPVHGHPTAQPSERRLVVEHPESGIWLPVEINA